MPTSDTTTSVSGDQIITSTGSENEKIVTGSGNDTVYAGDGSDTVNSGSGSDTVDGGAGSDTLLAGSGNDTLIYTLQENAGATDSYNAGSGYDTLVINLTEELWETEEIRAEILRYLDSLATVARNAKTGEVSSGQASDFTFNFQNPDGTTSVLIVQMTEKLEVYVNGVKYIDSVANDAPVISVGGSDSDARTLTETNAGVATSGTLSVFDADKGNTVSVLEVTGVSLGGTTGGLEDAHVLGMLSVGSNPVISSTAYSGSIAWGFDSGGEAFDFLAAGESLTLTYTLRVTDGSSSDDHTVTITITGTNDAVSVTAATAAGSATEDNDTATPDASGTISFTDADLSDGHTATFAKVGAAAALGTFELDPVSEVADAAGGSVGWKYTLDNAAANYLAAGQAVTETYTVTLSDGKGSTTTQDVTITITGANDAVSVTAATAAGSATEDNDTATPDASGTISFTDADLSDGHTATFAKVGAAAALGTFELDPVSEVADAAGGSVGWKYTLDNAAANYLAAGQAVTESYTITLDDGHGSTAAQTVTITVTGSNDGPLAVADAGEASEAGTAAGSNATGNVLSNDTDVDSGDTKAVSAVGGQAANVGAAVAGAYGTLMLNADGSYTYAVNNAHAAVDALRLSSDTLSDTFSYTMTDAAGASSTANLVITIRGSNDGPVAVADAGEASEAGTAAGSNATGNVLSNDTDVDSGDTKAVSAVGGQAANVGAAVAGAYGTLMLNADGSYTYAVNNAHAAVDALRVSSDTLSDTFNYTMTDAAGASSTANLVITIRGSNDGPVAVADAGEAAENGVQSFDVLANDTDVDAGDSKTLDSLGLVTLSSANGTIDGIDASSAFTIVGNQVQFTPGTLFDALGIGDTATVVVSYTMKDGSSASSSAALTLTIAGADEPVTNHAPTNIDFIAINWAAGNSLPGAGAATVIAMLEATDPDVGDTFTFQFADDTTTAVNNGATFGISGASLTASGLTSNKTYTLQVRATDSGGLSVTETLNVITGKSTGNDTLQDPSGTATYDDDDIIYTLGSGTNQKDVVFAGTGNDFVFGQDGVDELNGQEGNDVLYGGAVNDKLSGGTGNDTLNGGSGSDTFVFAETGSANYDIIADFNVADDSIQLSSTSFASGDFSQGVLKQTAFVSNDGGMATNGAQHYLYDTSTGALYYDADGTGATAKVLIAQFDLAGMVGTLTNADFVLGS